MTEAVSLPRYRPDEVALPGSLKAYLDELVSEIEKQLQNAQQSVGRQAYDPANVTHTTAIDGAASDLNTTRNVLASLISDLKRSGKLA